MLGAVRAELRSALRALGLGSAIAVALGSSAACVVEYALPEADAAPEDCELPLEICDGVCIDPRADEAHCGGCGDVCELGESCIDSECIPLCDEDCDPSYEVCLDGVCECRAGLELCEGDCVDTDSDVDHCGACGFVCDVGESCEDGGCVDICEGDACGDACVDIEFDPLHCGECDRACGSEELCVFGVCRHFYEPDGCNSCPCDCETEPGFTCCFSDYLVSEVCIEATSCEE